MKRLWLLLLLSASPLLADEFRIGDFSGGMYSYPSANAIPDNAASLIQNMYTDIEKVAQERNGYEKRDTTVLGGGAAVTGLWDFVDNSGNKWIISFSSKTFYKNTVGGTPTAFGLSATATTPPKAAVNLGKIWFVNGSDSLWWFDGTSTGTVSSAPVGKLIVSWRNRLVIGFITGSLSTLRFSADGDGTSWTLGGNPTDPFSLQIGGANDGYNIACLWGSYLDNMIVGRKRDTWAISGFDQADVEVRNISSEIGCIQSGSMREFDGSLVFMSARGMEEMQGYTIKLISEPIRNIVDPIVRNTADERSITQTSQADWAGGTQTTDVFADTTTTPGDIFPTLKTLSDTTKADFSSGTIAGNLSVILSSGDIIPSTYTVTETSQSDFNSGTVYRAETTSGGAVRISSNPWGGFEEWNTLGFAINPVSSDHWSSPALTPGDHGWHEGSNGGGSGFLGANCGQMNARTGNSFVAFFHDQSSLNMSVKVKDQSSGVVYATTTFAYADNSCSWTQRSLTLAGGDVGRKVYFEITDSFYGNDALTSTVFTVTETTINFYTRSDFISLGTRRVFFEDFTGFSDSTGTYTSQSYNTGISTALIRIIPTTTVQSNNAIGVALQDSTDGSTWRTLANVANSTTTYTGRQYLRYIATFTVTGALSGGLSTLDDVQLVSVGSGTFTSRTFDTALSTPIYGAFTFSTTTVGTGGTVSFFTQTSLDGNTWDTRVAATSGSLMPSARKRYFRYQVDLIPSHTTNYATVQSASAIARATGTFTTSAFSIGSNITAWGPVDITDIDNGGNITYQFNASATSSFNPSSWTAIVDGGIPTNNVNAFAAIRAIFDLDVATDTPTLSDLTISWSEGSAPAVVSWVHDRRYWLSYTTNTASGNYQDRVALYQRNRTWTLFSGINAASFANWRDNLYFGNSNSNGYVYKFDVGNSDDGSSIASLIQTKSYDLGVPERDKDFKNVWLTLLGNSGFSGSYTLTYDLDRLGQSFALGTGSLSEGTGQLSLKHPFPLTNPVQGREIQYTLSKTGTGNRLKLYGFKTLFSVKEEQ